MIRLVIAPAMPDGPGFVQVGSTPDGLLILDAEPRAVLPEGTTVLSAGSGRYARAALGAHADRVLDATWERTVRGKKERGRGKMAEALAHNPTVTITGSDITPHLWMGE